MKRDLLTVITVFVFSLGVASSANTKAGLEIKEETALSPFATLIDGCNRGGTS
jgi:hypothetical protein